MTHDATHDELLSDLMAQLCEVRAALAVQETQIAEQGAAFRALCNDARLGQVGQEGPTRAFAARPVSAEAPLAPAMQSASKAKRGANRIPGVRRGTTRRGLLRGAAAVTAAAGAVAVAVGGAQRAYAAPLATGDSVILGQSNDASLVTTLTNTTGMTPATLLQIGDGSFTGSSLVATTGAAVAITGNDTGASSGGIGVLGTSNFGVGVHGSTLFGTAVTGYGVMGSSNFNADLAATGTGRILQAAQASAGAPSTGTYTLGESIRDKNGELWLCIVSGSPGTWVQVLHLAPGATGGGVISYLSKPIRLLDTRVGENDANQNNGHSPCTSSSPVTVTVAGVNYNSVLVPANAVGAIGNVTVVASGGESGYLEVVPSGAGFTGAANLAYGPNQIVSNAFNVGLSGGNLDIIIGAGSVDVIVDLFAIVA